MNHLKYQPEQICSGSLIKFRKSKISLTLSAKSYMKRLEQLKPDQNGNIKKKSQQLIWKLTNFIQKVESIFKKILSEKHIQHNLNLAQTSSTQIVYSFTNSLEKFKGIIKKINTKQLQNQINHEILSFVLQYFADHMIAETHWSKKKTQQQSSFSLSNILQCKNHRTNSQQNLSEVYLKDKIQLVQNKINQSNYFNNPIQQTLNAILKIQDLPSLGEMSITQKTAYLFDLQSKIFVASQFIQSAAIFQNDITTLPKENYSYVWKQIKQNNLGNQKKITEQYRLLKKLMIITNAAVISQLQTDGSFGLLLQKVVFGLSFPRYFINFTQARFQNNKFLRKPSIHIIKSIWNLPENGLIKQIKKPFVFDYISQNIQFYVPRFNSTDLNHYKNRKYSPNLNIFQPNKNSIKVRLLNHQTLNIKNRSKTYKTILIHFHGGGFIALSSCTSQTYTRKWAKSLKVPVFSVDYGKPPEFKFPIPVLDCLQTYIFITTQIHKHFNISPQRVFVLGDSAGGNLACSLTALTLKLNLIKPEGIFLAYPAVDTRSKFSPSRINSFNDTILYPTLLMLCIKQYLGQDEQNQFHPLASPILLTQDYVSGKQNDKRWPQNWPKTIIVVGKKDPLHDDSIRLCQKLAKGGVEFHCELYKNLSHAFLSIDKMITECTQSIKDSIKFLQLLISGKRLNEKNW